MKVSQLLIERASSFEILKKYKKPLTDKERKFVMDKGAVWNRGPHDEGTSAVWKSVNPKTGKVTYVTNTHRAYKSCPTLKGAISIFHSFIKGTA